MYSRKFGQNGLPPDYGGVSFRHTPPESSPREAPPRREDGDCSPVGTPRYPTEDRHKAPPGRRYTVKRPEKKVGPVPKEEAVPRTGGLLGLAGRSFTMEDIVLAGLILLLLNSDCDSELLLVLGFLLLVGLQ